MTGQISNPHHLDPLTRSCFGCGKAVGAAKSEPECPAYYRQRDGLLIVVTPAERLYLIVLGQIGLRFDPIETFEIRDAIDEGIDQLRRSGRSTAGLG